MWLVVIDALERFHGALRHEELHALKEAPRASVRHRPGTVLKSLGRARVSNPCTVANSSSAHLQASSRLAAVPAHGKLPVRLDTTHRRMQNAFVGNALSGLLRLHRRSRRGSSSDVSHQLKIKEREHSRVSSSMPRVRKEASFES
jgi:hypothetical protein